ncbi:hypothetical protein F5Y18DRAFT_442896 [Xylariaceae sp. FL1019]|nr:hypothetical protein F5Y18DRAFT_442896 [Xylariaceae sp. FL1019]
MLNIWIFKFVVLIISQHAVVLVSVSLHPGVITSTNLSRSLAMEDFQETGVIDRKLGYVEYWNDQFTFKTPSAGVATHVFAAFHPSLDAPELNGSYLENCGVRDPRKILSWARDPIDAQSPWELSEQLVSLQFDY